MTKLIYINDRKGKFQSHEIRSKEEFENFYDGYGSNLSEALQEHKERIELLKKQIDEYYNDLQTGNIILVDEEEKEVKKEIIDNYYTSNTVEKNVEDIIREFVERR